MVGGGEGGMDRNTGCPIEYCKQLLAWECGGHADLSGGFRGGAQGAQASPFGGIFAKDL